MAGNVYQDTITDLRLMGVVGPEAWGTNGETIIRDLFGDSTVDLPVNVNSIQLPNESDMIRDVPNNGLTPAQLPVGLQPMDFQFEMTGHMGSRLATLRGYVTLFRATFVARAPDDIDVFGVNYRTRKQLMRGNLRDAEASDSSEESPQTWTFMQRVGELERWEVVPNEGGQGTTDYYMRRIVVEDWIDASGWSTDKNALYNRWGPEAAIRGALNAM